MLEARNINKYFNRWKVSEIHVINNTSLKLPEKGLVCLLGPSGSGKTTLLNVLGGLDKADSGEIIFQDTVLDYYSSRKWDNIRSRYFGYVFQDYVLLPDLTVYQNLELVLKSFHISKEEIETRIEYALAAVGMARYKKRKVQQLSGGQQQRVAIARALVKSPNVVLADEPTGNLDEKNTTQVMNIIKKISRECLVILVTHEKRLAEFYGDIIYEISDGEIVREITINEERTLQHLDDRNIYLKEFANEEISSEDLNVRYFYKGDKKKLDLNIIFQDGIFYINSPQENVKIKFLDKDSEIKVIDSQKPVLKSENIEKFDYFLPPIDKDVKERRNIFGFAESLKMAFRHLGSLRKRQKFIYFIMFLSSIMLTLGFVNFFMSKYVNEKNFLYFNRDLIQVKEVIFPTNQRMENFINNINAEYVLPSPSYRLATGYNINLFDQVSGFAYHNFQASFMPLGVVKEPKLILGRMPEKEDEILIDKYVAESMIGSYVFQEKGVRYIEQLLEIKVESENKQLEIVGIIDNNNPNFYMLDAAYKNFMLRADLAGVYPLSVSGIKYYYDPDDFEENRYQAEMKPIGDLQLEKGQVFISASLYISKQYFIIQKFVSDYEIVGVYVGDTSYALISDSDLDYNYINMLRDLGVFTVYSSDKDATITKIGTLGFTATDMYQRSYKKEKETKTFPMIYSVSLIIISASSVFLYFLMRSRLFSQIYEIGVYRALGIRKVNIYLIFMSEIIILTTISAVLGNGLVSWIIFQLKKTLTEIYFPWYLPFMSFGFMLGVNILVGLLPVWNLLRLTPSQILSKYDI